MANTNKRYRIVEGAPLPVDSEVAQFSLKDLLDFSSKAEDSAVKLLSASVDSDNKRLMSLVRKFKHVASEITGYISGLIMTGGVDQDDDMRIALESKSIKESAKDRYLKRKKLKESFESDQEDSHNQTENESDFSYKAYMEEDEMPNEEKVMGDNVPDKNTGTHSTGEVVIDLTEPYERAIEGLDDNQFTSFKSDVISRLEGAIDPVESKVDSTKADEFTKSIEALSATRSAEDFDLGMNQIYDFADANGILVETVKTKKKLLSNNKKKK